MDTAKMVGIIDKKIEFVYVRSPEDIADNKNLCTSIFIVLTITGTPAVG